MHRFRTLGWLAAGLAGVVIGTIQAGDGRPCGEPPCPPANNQCVSCPAPKVIVDIPPPEVVFRQAPGAPCCQMPCTESSCSRPFFSWLCQRQKTCTVYATQPIAAPMPMVSTFAPQITVPTVAVAAQPTTAAVATVPVQTMAVAPASVATVPQVATAAVVAPPTQFQTVAAAPAQFQTIAAAPAQVQTVALAAAPAPPTLASVAAVPSTTSMAIPVQMVASAPTQVAVVPSTCNGSSAGLSSAELAVAAAAISQFRSKLASQQSTQTAAGDNKAQIASASDLDDLSKRVDALTARVNELNSRVDLHSQAIQKLMNQLPPKP